MSQSKLAFSGPRHNRTNGSQSLSETIATERVLEALDDANCRTILAATRDTSLTVSELCEHTDVAQSTAYRKVEELVETGLLEENLRLRSSGNHVSTYACRVEDVTVTVDADSGIELSFTHAESDVGISTPLSQF